MLKRIGSFLGFFSTVVFMILFSPIIIVVVLISFFVLPSIEKEFRFLKKRGYKYKRKKVYRYYSKNNIVFKFKANESYKVKYFDNDFIAIEDTTIGTEYERKQLREDLIKYQGAHPVDKQRGEVDAITSFAEFLFRHIKDFEKVLVDK